MTTRFTRLPTECPRCEAEGEFVPKARETEHRWLEIYIRCATCRWERVIRLTTPELQALEKQKRKVVDRMQFEMDTHGQPTANTIAIRRRLGRQWARLQSELYEEARKVGAAPYTDAA